MDWFKRTPDQELAVDLRQKADEFNRAVGKAKRAGLSVTIWGRSWSGTRIIQVIDRVELERTKKETF